MGQVKRVKLLLSTPVAHPAQLRRSKTVEVEGNEGKFEPVELIRLGLH
jgi:hypothetical protein